MAYVIGERESGFNLEGENFGQNRVQPPMANKCPLKEESQNYKFKFDISFETLVRAKVFVGSFLKAMVYSAELRQEFVNYTVVKACFNFQYVCLQR